MYGALDRARSATFGIRVAVGLAGACVAVFLFRLALHATSDRVRALALAIPALACSFTVRSERPLMFGLVLLGARWCSPSRCRQSSLGRHPRVVIPVADVAVGERARHVLARLPVPRRVPRRPLRSTARRRSQGASASSLIGTAIAARARVRQPVRAEPGAVPARADGPQPACCSNVGEWQAVDLHTLTGLLYAVWIVHHAGRASRGRSRAGASCS